MLDGVDGAKNSRQITSPTIARAATAINGATFLADAVWLESDASAARSSAILVSQVSRHVRANYPLVNANLICPAWKPAWSASVVTHPCFRCAIQTIHRGHRRRLAFRRAFFVTTLRFDANLVLTNFYRRLSELRHELVGHSNICVLDCLSTHTLFIRAS
jgi:hypothetical protein